MKIKMFLNWTFFKSRCILLLGNHIKHHYREGLIIKLKKKKNHVNINQNKN